MPSRDGSSHPVPLPGGGAITRRAALRHGALAAGVLAAGAALAACGPSAAGGSSSAAAAGTTRSIAAKYKILWRPWYNFNEATTSTGHALLMKGIEPWLAKNKGVEVTITYMGYQQATVAAILAGTGPDIFADWVIPLFTSANLLLDLSKYVRQDNVNLSIFPQRDLQSFQSNGGLWALPSYLHLEAPTVNLGVLDSLGLSYPQPGWTYQQWTTLMRAATKKSTNPKQRRQGGQFYWSGYDSWGNDPAPHYLAAFGGEYVDPSNNTRCYLDNPGSQAALEWVYGLLAEGVCGTGSLNFVTGQQVVSRMDTAGGLIAAAQQYGGVKWQMYDEFVWPKSQVAYAASDFYGINAATKNPDIVWEFMKYLTVDTQWQKWMVHLALNGPNQKSLYPYWETTVKQTAQPLKNIDLAVFTRMMENNEPYFGLLFKYADQTAGQTIGAATKPALSNPQLVPQVCRQATNQVNAVESAGASETKVVSGLSKVFPVVHGTQIANVQPGL